MLVIELGHEKIISYGQCVMANDVNNNGIGRSDNIEVKEMTQDREKWKKLQREVPNKNYL